jgi:hypothetical protein
MVILILAYGYLWELDLVSILKLDVETISDRLFTAATRGMEGHHLLTPIHLRPLVPPLRRSATVQLSLVQAL